MEGIYAGGRLFIRVSLTASWLGSTMAQQDNPQEPCLQTELDFHVLLKKSHQLDNLS